jgi:hypothetical protein
MLKLDLLSLRQTESAGDVGKRFVGENDRTWSYGSDSAHELNVFNCFGEKLQSAAILFEESQTRSIDLTVNQQTHKAFMTQAGSEWELSLCDVESCFRITQAAIVQTRDVFEGGVAHCGVVAIDVEGSHGD